MTPKGSVRPFRKHSLEFIYGILSSKAGLLTDIARSLVDSGDEFRRTYKRIQRNTGHYDLRPLAKKLMTQNATNLTNEQVIALDIGDIAKPNAKCMEGLQQVADGSKDHAIVSGLGVGTEGVFWKSP